MNLIHRVSNSQRWLAPELCRDNGMLTTQSDIFAYGMTILEVRWNCTWKQVASLTVSFRSWHMRSRGTPFATRRTSSSSFLREKCLHVPKILRSPQGVWMTTSGSWFNSAGQSPLGTDLRQNRFFHCLDKNDIMSRCIRIAIYVSDIPAFELYISSCSLCYKCTSAVEMLSCFFLGRLGFRLNPHSCSPPYYHVTALSHSACSVSLGRSKLRKRIAPTF